MIAPFRPPNIEKRRREARESPRIKIDGSRVRNLIQGMLIISTTRNDLQWFNQVRKVNANRHLAKPQLTSTHWGVVKFLGGRLILSKNTRREKPWLDHFYKCNHVFIILVNVIEA
jgi:hypothetical protein